jgi:hypothetical protein
MKIEPAATHGIHEPRLSVFIVSLDFASRQTVPGLTFAQYLGVVCSAPPGDPPPPQRERVLLARQHVPASPASSQLIAEDDQLAFGLLACRIWPFRLRASRSTAARRPRFRSPWTRSSAAGNASAPTVATYTPVYVGASGAASCVATEARIRSAPMAKPMAGVGGPPISWTRPS